MSQTRVTWNLQYSGQKRAYADTTTEGVITIENDWKRNGFEPWDTDLEHAKRLAKVFVGWDDDENGDPFSRRLRTFEKIGPGQYYLFLLERYND